MIAYAEKELVDKDGKLILCLSNTQRAIREAAIKRGYGKIEYQEEQKQYEYSKGDLNYKLHSGSVFCVMAKRK